MSGAVSASTVRAERAIVTAGSDAVSTDGNRVTITVALPAMARGARIDRAVLEVPISIQQSTDSRFDEFPLLELVQAESELPKQTALLQAGFSGVTRLDVTRFVRTWSNSDAHQFILGTLSGANKSALVLGSAADWERSTKARLVLRSSAVDGASASEARAH